MTSLPRARGGDQRFHQFRIGTGAVHRLLDGDHVGIGNGLLDEIDHRLERLVGVMQQYVVLAQHLEHVRALLLQQGGHAGHERRELEIVARDLVRDAHQAHQIHRTFHAEQVFRFQLELLQQEFGHGGRAVVGDFQPHRIAEVALRQFALQADAQVLHFFLVHEQVAVARHAELVTAQHFHAREQFADMRVQDGRQEHETVRTAGDFGRQQDGARQHARRLHDGLGRIAPERILALQFDGEIQALVEHARERMRGVEPDGRQHRHHFAQEEILDPGFLRFVPLGAAQELDALLGQRRDEFVVEKLVLPCDELVRRLRTGA